MQAVEHRQTRALLPRAPTEEGGEGPGGGHKCAPRAGSALARTTHSARQRSPAGHALHARVSCRPPGASRRYYAIYADIMQIIRSHYANKLRNKRRYYADIQVRRHYANKLCKTHKDYHDADITQCCFYCVIMASNLDTLPWIYRMA